MIGYFSFLKYIGEVESIASSKVSKSEAILVSLSSVRSENQNH